MMIMVVVMVMVIVVGMVIAGVDFQRGARRLGGRGNLPRSGTVVSPFQTMRTTVAIERGLGILKSPFDRKVAVYERNIGDVVDNEADVEECVARKQAEEVCADALRMHGGVRSRRGRNQDAFMRHAE